MWCCTRTQESYHTTVPAHSHIFYSLLIYKYATVMLCITQALREGTYTGFVIEMIKTKKVRKKMTVSSDLLVLLLKEIKKSSFSHTPLWTQTPSAFQVNHFSLVLVGWTQMETVKYYQAVITFHLSCNRSLHARYNHHLLHIVSLSLSLPLLVYISVAWIQTQLHTP